MTTDDCHQMYMSFLPYYPTVSEENLALFHLHGSDKQGAAGPKKI